MGDFIDPIAQSDVALLRLLVAGLLGGLIGLERERSEARAGGRAHFAGVRTFPIFAIMGAGVTLIAGDIGIATVAAFLGVAALVVVSYVQTSRQGDLGSTTEMAALATYWAGAMAGAGALVMAGAIGIGVAVLLALKTRLEAFPRTLTSEELEAALTLAVIAAVVLPVLPNRGYGPWGVWNPRQLWGMVVIVCGLSFAAFVAMRLWGSTRGVYLSGLLGGLVSSTAVTVSFAARSRDHPAHGRRLAVAGGFASLVMVLRIGLLTAVAGPAALRPLGPVLGAMVAGAGVAAALLGRRGATAGDSEPRVTNPFSLGQALRFAVLYAVVLLAVEAAARYLGAWGVAAAAVLAGFTDVDAITLSLAGLADTEPSAGAAAGGIALAALANTAAKAGYAAWLGSPSFRRGMLAILGAAFAAGTLALVVTGLRPWSP
jgi:uncharacterized membrane protein (DUF4010 family)